MNSVDHQVRRSWERIEAWLRARRGDGELLVAPTAGQSDLDAVERELGLAEPGLALPPELAALWRLDGVLVDYWLPPEGGAVLLHPAEALDERAVRLAAADEEPAAPNRFAPQLLPVAVHGGGDWLVVDPRPGARHGAVFLWRHEDPGLRTPLWPGVAAMLADIAEALETGAPALRWHADRGGTEPPCAAVVSEDNEFEGWLAVGPG